MQRKSRQEALLTRSVRTSITAILLYTKTSEEGMEEDLCLCTNIQK